jgi:hypothetical protein
MALAHDESVGDLDLVMTFEGYPGSAGQEIDHMVAVIHTLVERRYAYAVVGDVYFQVTRDSDYGKLSHRRLDEIEAGSRVQVDVGKEHPMDFASGRPRVLPNPRGTVRGGLAAPAGTLSAPRRLRRRPFPTA